jgi:tetratricopeptide (TPR) repeat protein
MYKILGFGLMANPRPTDSASQQPMASPSPAAKAVLADKPWLLALVLVIVTLLVYLPVWHAGFVWDDERFITSNHMLQAPDGLYRIWFTTEAMDYYPLTSSFWWLQWRLWGTNAAGWHAVNILFHAANVVLVWMVLRRLKIPGAWLAALLFAVHPVNVATAAWISEQKNTLSMLFFALSILWYLRFDDEGGWRWYGISLSAFLLALFSKTAVVMLPVVLLGCVWWLRGRLRPKDWLCTVPFFFLSLVMGFVSIWFEYNRDLGGHATRTDGFLSHLAVAGLAPWFYLSKAVLPLDLNVIYPKWEIDPHRLVSWLPAALWIGCFLVFWRQRKTWGRAALFGFGYFIVTLFPVLGFFDQGFYRFSLVADHWQYYSIVGIVALGVVAGERICREIAGENSSSVKAVASVLVLTALAAATWTRASLYANAETLWRDTIARNPNAWVAHYNLGLALARSGRLQEAVGHWEQALRIKPDYVDAHNNLGVALDQAGRIPEAMEHLEQALRIKPDSAEAHYNLGKALAEAGRVPEAIAHYEQALRLKPDYAEAHCNLGVALKQSGRIPEAVAQYEQALRIKPDFAEAHCCLGNALLQEGKISDAIAQTEQALRIKPDFAEAYYNLGLALWQAGKTPEAISQWQQALHVQPDYVEAHGHLAIALEQTHNVREAIEHYEQALRVKPDYVMAQNNLAWLLATLAPAEGGDPVRAEGLAERACKLTSDRVAPYLDTLAAAYAAAGRFRDAVTTAQAAVDLARSSGQTQVVSEIETRLELYRSGRAYHAPGSGTSPSPPAL